MCRRFSAETEAALAALVKAEESTSSDSYKNLEWLALNALSEDLYQLPIVRKAIRYYLRYGAKLPVAQLASMSDSGISRWSEKEEVREIVTGALADTLDSLADS